MNLREIYILFRQQPIFPFACKDAIVVFVGLFYLENAGTALEELESCVGRVDPARR